MPIAQDEMKLDATAPALALLAELKLKYGNELLFHQSGGCCDGSAPMLFPQNDYIVGDNDVLIGEISGIPFYISGSQFQLWKHTDLVIDAIKGIGGMFSLDNGSGMRFLTRSEICNRP